MPRRSPPGFTTGCGRPNGHGSGCRRDYDVCHFRKSFSLERLPGHFLVHVSADNRYKLFVNGRLVSLGPALGDVYNWNFETVDLAPLSCAGTQRAGGRSVALRGEASSGTDDLRQPGIPSSGEHPGGRRRKYRCVMALSAQYGLCALRRAVLGYYAAGAL